jgi:ribonucleoside-triphosphate reductase
MPPVPGGNGLERIGGDEMGNCNSRAEVFSRVVGYFRPVARWNEGKKEEFCERSTYNEEKAMEKDFSGIRKSAS